MILLIFSIAHAQTITFAPPLTNPFGLPITPYVQGAKFADLDGDGDQDLMISEIWGTECPFHYYENIGTPTELELASPTVNPFGLVSTPGYAFQTFTDLDADGDFDLMVGVANGNFKYFENTGTVTEPKFAPPVSNNQFGLTPTIVTAIVEFVDLDGDEDFDLWVGEDDGVMQYFENIGSVTEPNFASPVANPFGYVPSPTNHSSAVSFADLDEDGDFDMLLCVGGTAIIEYFENIGNDSIPLFTVPIIDPFDSVFALTGNWGAPDFADLDADGDEDVFISYQGNSQYYENTTINVHIEDIPQSMDIGIYPNPVMDILYFEAEEQIDRIEIFSISGKVRVFENPKNQILMNDITPGLYILKIISMDGGFAVKKIQKL